MRPGSLGEAEEPPCPWYLPVKHSSGQWRPRRHSYIQRLSHWDQLALDRSLDQAVFNLQPDEGRPSTQVGKCIRLSDPPCGSIRDARVEHFARPNQVVESSHDFFGGWDLMPHIDPIYDRVHCVASLQHL